MVDLKLHTPEDAGMNAAALENLRQSIQADIAADRMFGASMIVARGGKVVLREAFGTVAPGRKAALDDVYLMMSVTKSFTAMLALRAVDRGLITLDTRIAALFPEFAAEGKDDITLFHVLTHQAGMPIMPAPPAPLTLADMGNIDREFGALCGIKPLFPAGTQTAYSSFMGYVILAKVVEKLDPQGRSFRQIAHEDLFAPLGMASSDYGHKQDNPKRVLVSHTPTMEKGFSTMGNMQQTRDFLNSLAGEGKVQPAGNAFGTIDDLFRYADTLRRGGTLDGYRLISPSLLAYATQNHCGTMENLSFAEACKALKLPPLRANYGLHGGYVRDQGHFLNICGYTASPRAFGGMGGGSTFYMVDPARDLTVAFLSAGFIEGVAHLVRVARLNDLALAACS